MGDISRRQMGILRHALGWPKDDRNRFITGPGSSDYDDCEALVAAGYMTVRPPLSWMPDNTYHVTEAGKVAVKMAEGD